MTPRVSRNLTWILAILSCLFHGFRAQEAAAGNNTKKILEPEELDLADTAAYRLPATLNPRHYVVRLMPFINSNYSIHGRVEITFDVAKPTNKIVFHIRDIITKNDTTKVEPVDGPEEFPLFQILSQEYNPETDFYTATLDRSLLKGKTYKISMEYEGYINDKLKGLYRSTYEDQDGNKKRIAITQFQPTDARRAFPCFDEPALKANFTIEIAREDMMSSISNMPLEKTLSLERHPGWVVDHFATSVPMSTYLVALMVSQFDHISDDGKPLFRVWARRSAINHTSYAIDKGPKISRFFEDYFRIPFPLPKQDMTALPDFSAGAMENWGLITYRETALLFDPLLSNHQDKQRVGYVLAHELAHQWFGNLVTPSWWTDLWLNEGFATYMGHLGLSAVEPTWKVMDLFVVEKTMNVQSLDALESSHPISTVVGHPNTINELFDGISYNKGASLIRMMVNIMTENSFRAGLHNYLKTFEYSSATQDDLWQHLTAQAHNDGTLAKPLTVKAIMDTWTLQMGYPVITVTKVTNDNVTITQERFLTNPPDNSTDTREYRWWVPISYITQSHPDPSKTLPIFWLSPEEKEKTVADFPSKSTDWFLVNPQITGYYKVNYDQENWHKLMNQLDTDPTVLHPLDRATLIDNAFAFARAGRLDYVIPLDMMRYIPGENEFSPLKVAFDNLSFITGMLFKTDLWESFREFYRSLAFPKFEETGLDGSQEKPHLDQKKSSMLGSVSCHLDNVKCLQSTKTLFRKWMREPNNHSIVPPNIKGIVYCNTLKYSGEDEWNFALRMYKESNTASEKVTLLSSLGCTEDRALSLRLLNMIFEPDSAIRKQDMMTVLASVGGSKSHPRLVWEFFRDNYDRFLEYAPSKWRFAVYALAGTGRFKTRHELKELEDFRSSHKELQGTGTLKVDQAIEKISNRIKWLDNNYAVIEEWLSFNGFNNQSARLESQ